MDIILAVLIVTVTGLLAAIILVVAAKVMFVEEDARIGAVAAVLPGANCGACGYAGCADYAKAIVEAGEKVTLCIPGGNGAASAVAEVMGVVAEDVASVRAVIACQGSRDNAKEKYEYEGAKSCAACASLFGGNFSCAYSCLGFGDCAEACKFGAIDVVNGVAKINQEKCTGCGACTAVCPKKVISLMDASDKPMVLCSNKDKGAIVRKMCTIGCIACTKCVKTCPSDAIHMEKNVAVIDQEKCTNCGACVDACPVHAIQRPSLR